MARLHEAPSWGRVCVSVSVLKLMAVFLKNKLAGLGEREGGGTHMPCRPLAAEGHVLR